MTKRLLGVALIGALFGIAADAGWGRDVGMAVGAFMTLVGVINVWLVQREERRGADELEAASPPGRTVIDLARRMPAGSAADAARAGSTADPAATSPLGTRCEICGGARLSWRVHRAGTRHSRISGREVRWVCQDCDHEWGEPIPGGA